MKQLSRSLCFVAVIFSSSGSDISLSVLPDAELEGGSELEGGELALEGGSEDGEPLEGHFAMLQRTSVRGSVTLTRQERDSKSEAPEHKRFSVLEFVQSVLGAASNGSASNEGDASADVDKDRDAESGNKMELSSSKSKGIDADDSQFNGDNDEDAENGANNNDNDDEEDKDDEDEDEGEDDSGSDNGNGNDNDNDDDETITTNSPDTMVAKEAAPAHVAEGTPHTGESIASESDGSITTAGSADNMETNRKSDEEAHGTEERTSLDGGTKTHRESSEEAGHMVSNSEATANSEESTSHVVEESSDHEVSKASESDGSTTKAGSDVDTETNKMPHEEAHGTERRTGLDDGMETHRESSEEAGHAGSNSDASVGSEESASRVVEEPSHQEGSKASERDGSLSRDRSDADKKMSDKLDEEEQGRATQNGSNDEIETANDSNEAEHAAVKVIDPSMVDPRVVNAANAARVADETTHQGGSDASQSDGSVTRHGSDVDMETPHISQEGTQRTDSTNSRGETESFRKAQGEAGASGSSEEDRKQESSEQGVTVGETFSWHNASALDHEDINRSREEESNTTYAQDERTSSHEDVQSDSKERTEAGASAREYEYAHTDSTSQREAAQSIGAPENPENPSDQRVRRAQEVLHAEESSSGNSSLDSRVDTEAVAEEEALPDPSRSSNSAEPREVPQVQESPQRSTHERSAGADSRDSSLARNDAEDKRSSASSSEFPNAEALPHRTVRGEADNNGETPEHSSEIMGAHNTVDSGFGTADFLGEMPQEIEPPRGSADTDMRTNLQKLEQNIGNSTPDGKGEIIYQAEHSAESSRENTTVNAAVEPMHAQQNGNTSVNPMQSEQSKDLFTPDHIPVANMTHLAGEAQQAEDSSIGNASVNSSVDGGSDVEDHREETQHAEEPSVGNASVHSVLDGPDVKRESHLVAERQRAGESSVGIASGNSTLDAESDVQKETDGKETRRAEESSVGNASGNSTFNSKSDVERDTHLVAERQHAEESSVGNASGNSTLDAESDVQKETDGKETRRAEESSVGNASGDSTFNSKSGVESDTHLVGEKGHAEESSVGNASSNSTVDAESDVQKDTPEEETQRAEDSSVGNNSVDSVLDGESDAERGPHLFGERQNTEESSVGNASANSTLEGESEFQKGTHGEETQRAEESSAGSANANSTFNSKSDVERDSHLVGEKLHAEESSVGNASGNSTLDAESKETKHAEESSSGIASANSTMDAESGAKDDQKLTQHAKQSTAGNSSADSSSDGESDVEGETNLVGERQNADGSSVDNASANSTLHGESDVRKDAHGETLQNAEEKFQAARESALHGGSDVQEDIHGKESQRTGESSVGNASANSTSSESSMHGDKRAPAAESQRSQSNASSHETANASSDHDVPCPTQSSEAGKAKTQQGNGTSWHNVTKGLGEMAPLDNSGFEEVAGEKDEEELRKFVYRTVRKAGLLVFNRTGMQTLIQQCVAGKGPRSFDHLSEELFAAATHHESWIGILRRGTEAYKDEAFKFVAKPSLGPGLTEPLNEAGYQAVAKKNSTDEMNAYMHRVINHLGLEVKDKNAFLGVVPWYSGETATQTYSNLINEVLQTSLKPDMWVAVAKKSEAAALNEW